MIRFFRKKNVDICSPVAGKCIDITEVSDKIFADKVIGDGVAVIPQNNIIAAPCDGVISSIFPTGHAFLTEGKGGPGILVHIGIDTVNLNGRGFKTLVRPNTSVKKGEPVIEFDSSYLSDERLDMTVMIIVSEGSGEIRKTGVGENVISKDVVMEYKLE